MGHRTVNVLYIQVFNLTKQCEKNPKNQKNNHLKIHNLCKLSPKWITKFAIKYINQIQKSDDPEIRFV